MKFHGMCSNWKWLPILSIYKQKIPNTTQLGILLTNSWILSKDSVNEMLINLCVSSVATSGYETSFTSRGHAVGASFYWGSIVNFCMMLCGLFVFSSVFFTLAIISSVLPFTIFYYHLWYLPSYLLYLGHLNSLPETGNKISLSSRSITWWMLVLCSKHLINNRLSFVKDSWLC